MRGSPRPGRCGRRTRAQSCHRNPGGPSRRPHFARLTRRAGHGPGPNRSVPGCTRGPMRRWVGRSPLGEATGPSRGPRILGEPTRARRDGLAHEPDHPADAPRGLRRVHLPVHDHALVAGHAPQHVEDGRRHRCGLHRTRPRPVRRRRRAAPRAGAAWHRAGSDRVAAAHRVGTRRRGRKCGPSRRPRPRAACRAGRSPPPPRTGASPRRADPAR